MIKFLIALLTLLALLTLDMGLRFKSIPNNRKELIYVYGIIAEIKISS